MGHYATLNISPGASQDEIRLAYVMLKQVHAAKGKTPPPVVREAYETLRNPTHRQRYDAGPASALVNIDAIKEFHTLSKGTYKVVLRDGTELATSRNYRTHLEEFFSRSSLVSPGTAWPTLRHPNLPQTEPVVTKIGPPVT